MITVTEAVPTHQRLEQAKEAIEFAFALRLTALCNTL
jgi:hypothetical protein